MRAGGLLSRVTGYRVCRDYPIPSHLAEVFFGTVETESNNSAVFR